MRIGAQRVIEAGDARGLQVIVMSSAPVSGRERTVTDLEFVKNSSHDILAKYSRLPVY